MTPWLSLICVSSFFACIELAMDVFFNQVED